MFTKLRARVRACVCACVAVGANIAQTPTIQQITLHLTKRA